jgi:hypothetical protein
VLKDFAQRNFLRAVGIGRMWVRFQIWFAKYEIGTYHSHIYKMTAERDQVNDDISKAIEARLKLEGYVRRLEQRL